MYWLLGPKSKLSTSIKLLIHKTILKPTWTYGIQPWYVTNTIIQRDLQISTVKEEIRRYSSQYSARLS
jgi:hypothetical protein